MQPDYALKFQHKARKCDPYDPRFNQTISRECKKDAHKKGPVDESMASGFGSKNESELCHFPGRGRLH